MEGHSVGSVAVVRGVYEAFDRGDLPAVWCLLDPAVTFAEPPVSRVPYAGFYSGPRSVVTALLRHEAELWEDFRVVPETFVETGESVIVLGSFKGVGRETGETLRLLFAHECFLRDGKVLRIQSYPGAALAMGLPE